MEQIKTYPEMNKEIVNILRLPPHDDPLHLYAAQLIEEQAATLADKDADITRLTAELEQCKARVRALEQAIEYYHQGECDCCAYTDKGSDESPCRECSESDSHDYWKFGIEKFVKKIGQAEVAAPERDKVSLLNEMITSLDAFEELRAENAFLKNTIKMLSKAHKDNTYAKCRTCKWLGCECEDCDWQFNKALFATKAEQDGSVDDGQ